MNKEKRYPIIAGNWKMNNTPNETANLLDEIILGLKNPACKVIVCVPFIDINEAVNKTKNTEIYVGAQNCHFESKGAYTGEVSPFMLRSVDVDYVILGHSERRAYFMETNEIINKKVKSALKAGLKVILCVGETLKEKEHNITEEIISMQVKKALYNVDGESLDNITLAYEPVWAIGTGKTATPEEADDVCKMIRRTIENLYGATKSEKISILYGGSMNSKNAKDLLNMENIDGGLIGGASLKSQDFLSIIEVTAN